MITLDSDSFVIINGRFTKKGNIDQPVESKVDNGVSPEDMKLSQVEFLQKLVDDIIWQWPDENVSVDKDKKQPEGLPRDCRGAEHETVSGGGQNPQR